MPYTKGPWTVEVLQELTDTGERRPASYISSSQGWANSGMAGKRTIAVIGHWRDRPNPEDDARLIATAPKLLEALERLVLAFDVGDMMHTTLNGRGYAALSESRETIRNAKS